MLLTSLLLSMTPLLRTWVPRMGWDVEWIEGDPWAGVKVGI